MLSSNSSSNSINVESDGITLTGNKKALKEGSVQLTSLSTLLSHHRYFFLYNDILIVSKQKGALSYKLKEKHRLENIWIASSNTSDSFLIGWPFTNYLVHFRNAEEKDEWFELFSYCVQQKLRPLFTTIPMDINVRGRKQTIRRRVENGKKSGELVLDTACDLGLPHTSYQLNICVGEGSSRTLQGPENVFVVIMSEIERQGIRISESQKLSLDTCPIANARLVLSTMKSNGAPSPRQIVSNIKKRVLQRTDGKCLFGKELNGPTPPQPIMTIVDHLTMSGVDVEGIFRKSPKQSTFKELKTELDKGLVPDFHKYNSHVLASILKEYLRSIPGKILLSGNYELWMREVADETNEEKKVTSCKSLLSHLPTSHSILLANVLKLLNKISTSSTSKMTASSLSVCLAPSFLESPEPMEGGKKIPPLVEFLIKNAAQVIPGFLTDNIFSIIHETDHNANVLCSPAPSSSYSEDRFSQKTPIIAEETEDEEEKKDDLKAPLFSDTDSEDEVADRTFSRSTFVTEALRPSISDKPETPRSPCLKRIHFQRTEVHHRTKEGSIKLDYEALKFHRKTSLEEAAARKTSTDGCVTPTPDETAAPPTRKVAVLAPPTFLMERKESREEATQTAAEAPSRRFPVLTTTEVESPPIPADPAPKGHYESYQPKPVFSDPPQPSLKTITERLNALRQNSYKAETFCPSPEVQRLVRSEARSLTNSPVITRNTKIHRPFEQQTSVPEEPYAPRCRKSELLQRSSSHREALPPQEDAHRIPSIRRRADACVGMEPMEINWSVRQLKTLFQGSNKAPAINTDYTFN